MRGRPRSVIKAKDPMVRRLLEAVAASPMTDCEIMEMAGCDRSSLYRLRSGSRMVRVVTIASIAEAVGMELRVEPKRPFSPFLSEFTGRHNDNDSDVGRLLHRRENGRI